MLDSLALERQRDWQRSEISLMLESAADRLAWSESVQRVDVAHWLCTSGSVAHVHRARAVQRSSVGAPPRGHCGTLAGPIYTAVYSRTLSRVLTARY